MRRNKAICFAALAGCLTLAGCIVRVPRAVPDCVRTPCGVGVPACVPPRFSEPQVPIFSPSGDLQLMPRSQFKIWDTTTPLGDAPAQGFK